MYLYSEKCVFWGLGGLVPYRGSSTGVISAINVNLFPKLRVRTSNVLPPPLNFPSRLPLQAECFAVTTFVKAEFETGPHMSKDGANSLPL